MVNEIAIKTIPELDLGCNVGEVLIGWWLKLHERGLYLPRWWLLLLLLLLLFLY